MLQCTPLLQEWLTLLLVTALFMTTPLAHRTQPLVTWHWGAILQVAIMLQSAVKLAGQMKQETIMSFLAIMLVIARQAQTNFISVHLMLLTMLSEIFSMGTSQLVIFP